MALSPDVCELCFWSGETNKHLFMHCPFSWRLWVRAACSYFKVAIEVQGLRQKGGCCGGLFCLLLFGVCLEHHNCVFKSQSLPEIMETEEVCSICISLGLCSQGFSNGLFSDGLENFIVLILCIPQDILSSYIYSYNYFYLKEFSKNLRLSITCKHMAIVQHAGAFLLI